jgi:hypothetical protein
MYALTLDCWDRNGEVKVRHIFYGSTEEECRYLADKEMDEDGYLADAEEHGRTGEFLEHIGGSEVPSAEDYADDVEAVDVETTERE